MQRQAGFILTIATVALCVCPGIIFCFWGLIISSIGLGSDGAQFKLDTGLDPLSTLPVGLGGICIGLILVVIPVMVWFFTARNNPA